MTDSDRANINKTLAARSWRRALVIQYLENVPSATTATLAQRFGVTHATITKDLAALRAQGETIETGPNGVTLR